MLSIAVEGVRADSESTYVVTATSAKSEEVTINKIESSVPLSGNLEADKWAYYWFTTSNAMPVYAVTVPTAGDPNMYVGIVKDLNAKKSEWKLPNEQKYLKKSDFSIAADILILSETDLED